MSDDYQMPIEQFFIQLYHGENKLHFDELIMMSAFY
jgi:hypothetical protein